MFGLYIVAGLTFGRNSAQYWGLITVLAVVSVALWVAVVLTTLVRLLARLLWHRRASLPLRDEQAAGTAELK